MLIFKTAAIFLCCIRCDPIPPQTSVQRLAHTRNITTCCFCGVPEVTLYQSDPVPRRITRCLRTVRKCLNQVCKQPLIPLLFNFSRSRSWGTLSNALARSRKTTSVAQDKFCDFALSFIDDNSCFTVDLPFRKPNWLFFVTPVSCQNLCNLKKNNFAQSYKQ